MGLEYHYVQLMFVWTQSRNNCTGGYDISFSNPDHREDYVLFYIHDLIHMSTTNTGDID